MRQLSAMGSTGGSPAHGPQQWGASAAWAARREASIRRGEFLGSTLSWALVEEQLWGRGGETETGRDGAGGLLWHRRSASQGPGLGHLPALSGPQFSYT